MAFSHWGLSCMTSTEPDFNPYEPQNVALFEALYGRHLISLGGLAAVDAMFAGVSIEGCKALDVGFGLGGVAYYLATKYAMDISGVEIHPWMVRYAKEHAPHELQYPLNFQCYEEDGTLPFGVDSFDVIYSKGVLNHVHHKIPLFQQLHACLKEDGMLVIADWIYPEMPVDNTGPLICETEASYQNALHQAGFKRLEFDNTNVLFITYVHDFLTNLAINRDEITTHFGEETYASIQSEHEALLGKLMQGTKVAVRILATR
jgi:SAM-dependent methyltransferase